MLKRGRSIVRGSYLGLTEDRCPYIADRQSTTENLIIPDASEEDLETLLEQGFRHFGRHYFRPVCPECGRCLPLRLRMADYLPTKSARRILRKNVDLDTRFDAPDSRAEAYNLYRLHKRRFETVGKESFQQFTGSFFEAQQTSRHLSTYLDGCLVAVLHLDVTPLTLSAIYCYYDDSLGERSLGTHSILLAIEHARKLGLRHVYLGYLVAENRHMAYKARYRPSEIRTREAWAPYKNTDGTIVGADAFRRGFRPSPLIPVDRV